jgi:cytochrome P450
MHDVGPLLPPGPRTPAWWQLLRYAHSPLTFIEECARRFGTTFTLRWSHYGTAVMLDDADSIKDIFRGDSHALHSGEANAFLSVSVGRTSVLVLDDDAHARQRRLVVPPLKGERMRSFFDAMIATTREEIGAWPRGKSFRILPVMRRITLRVIAQAVLGLNVGPELREFEHRTERVLANSRPNRYSIALLPLFPAERFANSRWMPFFRQLRQLDELIFAFIAKRRVQPSATPCVIADLLSVPSADGQSMSDVEIRDAIVTLILAGHDTTSIALAWAIEQIGCNPAVADRITGEVRQLAGNELHPEHLEQLAYLDAAIRESMRVRTIIPFVVRLTKKVFNAGGRDYPPGIMLAPCSHLVHRRPDLYPEPDIFRPERFLERKFGTHEWFPFGGGNRVCLGMPFALYEMNTVLAELFRTVKVRVAAPGNSRAVRQGLSLAPHDGVVVMIE